MKYTIEIVFGHSFLNNIGKSIYGNNLTRKILVKAEADTPELAVSAANVEFGVEFKEDAMFAGVYVYNISKDSTLILRLKK